MSWITENYGFDFESDFTYQMVTINQLSSELSQVVVFGVVIAKQDIRRISSKNQMRSERFVLNFTIRDSPNDTINAACWGDENSISTLATSFTIGNVVKIKNPQIIERHADSSDEKFKPPVNSQYQLNISPQYSEITVCSDDKSQGYEKFLHYAVHSASKILNLADVVYNSQSAEGLTVNLLVAIREVGSIQTVKTKDGREVKKLQLSVFDQSHPMFSILIWEEETAKFILKYCRKRSVILISNIRVNYNNFMKEMIGTSGSTTIFTPDPAIADARVLYQYAMKITIKDDNIHNTRDYSDPSTVYTVEQIVKLMNASEMSMNEVHGTLHATISLFDIDSTNNITSFRCPGCLQQLKKKEDKCINGACQIGSGMSDLPGEEMYDISLALSDNTGCIERCLLPGQAAQNFLRLKVEDFLRLSDDDRTTLKWNYLFARVTVQFKISQPSLGNGRCTFRVSSCQKSD